MELPLAPAAPQGKPLRGRPGLIPSPKRDGALPAPLPRGRFAVAGWDEGAVKRMERPASDRSPAVPQQEDRAMSGHDAELELFRNSVNCAAVLEHRSPAWHLDRKGSTRRAMKFRRGEGEIVIVNHGGRGWWDPQSAAKGDVFDLVQFLDPGLNFGQVRQVLRPFIGVSPTGMDGLQTNEQAVIDRPLQERWMARRRLRRGSKTWAYLTVERALPVTVLELADACNAVREGPYGSAWFAHRDADNEACHIEIRGPDFKGSLRGGNKALFRVSANLKPQPRLVVVEAPIDALSLAALEGTRSDSLYVATGGGMGPGTERAIEGRLAAISSLPNALLVSGADANLAGDRFAVRHAELAARAGVAFERLRPPDGTDWNDVLKRQQGRRP